MAKRMTIRVKVNDRCEYVEISEEMLCNHEMFIRHVMHSLDLDSSQAASINIFDQNNFRIPVDLFPAIMPNFLNPSVYIKLVFNMHDDISFDLNLEDFLKQSGCKSIFTAAKEACRLKKELDLKSVHYLSDKLVHFLDIKNAEGSHVNAQNVAESLIRLMPCIKMKTLYGVNKGILYNKVKYRKYKTIQNKCVKSITEEAVAVVQEPAALGSIVDQMTELTIDEELAYLLFFKTCLIGRDKEILKIKLMQTVAFREKTLKKRETKFVETFPFYFVSPDLILYDYGLRFIGENALLEKWPKLKMDVFNLLLKRESEECVEIGFDDETSSFLMVLWALSMRKTFERNVQKLITFSNNVEGLPSDLIIKNNVHPYILAVGNQKNAILNYYIDIENTLIPVPSDFGFLQTFDMFFKCHKVFNIEYNNSFVKLMHFIDYYIFEDKDNSEIDITVAMQKVAHKLNMN